MITVLKDWSKSTVRGGGGGNFDIVYVLHFFLNNLIQNHNIPLLLQL